MDREKTKSKAALIRAITLNPNTPDILNAEDTDPQEKNQQEQGQANVHQFILSEFKEKYDQLKAQFEAKKKEADALLYDKKKLEIELLNHNVEYYEKEIVRLRVQVEKYQLENEQNKHRFFVAENIRKDLQATSKVKQQELKITLKQLQKQKITVVELRYQLGETSKNFTNIIADIQKNNHEIAQKYDEATASLLKTQNDLKATKAECDRLKLKNQELQTTLKNKEEEDAAFNEKVQLTNYRSKHRIEDLEEEIKDIKTLDNDKIKKLEAQVKELQSKRKSEEFLLVQKEQAASFAQDLRKKEGEVANLEERLRELTFALSERDQKILSLEEKLKNVCSIQLFNESEQKYAEGLNNHKVNERALESRIINLQKELEMAKLRSSSALPAVQDPRMKADFQQLLKSQIQQNAKLKMQLSTKIDQIFALKNSIEEQNARESLLENEIDILKKRQRAQEKNSKISFEIEIQNLRNDVETLRRKVEVTEAKLAIKIKEVKDKDSFISSVIIGRSRQQDVPFVVAQLKRIFQAEYVSKLAEANLKIQDLQARAGKSIL